MLLPTDFGDFLQSEESRRCEEQLSRPSQIIERKDFYAIRDYLILRLLAANAQRPGAAIGISENVISKAHIDEDGGAVLAVSIFNFIKCSLSVEI